MTNIITASIKKTLITIAATAVVTAAVTTYTILKATKKTDNATA